MLRKGIGMGLTHGADVERLRGVADRMDGLVRLVAQTAGDVRATGSMILAAWDGPDSEEFERSGDHAARTLEHAGERLAAFALVLRSNADQQERTSGGGGLGSTGAPGGPLPDGPGRGGDSKEPVRYVPPGPLDQGKVDDLARDIRAFDRDGGFNGNRDELERLAERIRSLSPAEAESLVRSLSPEELAALNAVITDTGDTWLNPIDHNGLEPWQRQELSSSLLAKLTPEQQAKLQAAMPWTQPGFDTTDVALDGQNSQTGEQADGMRYGPPPDKPLFHDGVAGTDINQGSFADCWALASLAALAQQDPAYVQSGFRENPNGTISVRLFDKDGHERWVTVTRDLPVTADGSLAGAQNGSSNELWPAYYEKALAQMYQDDTGGAPDGRAGNPVYDRAENGTYAGLEWDYTDKAPPYITGQASHDVHGFDGVREAIASQEGVLVATLGSKPDGAPGAYHARHVYYVKGFEGDKIVLGNPWGPGHPDMTLTEDEYTRWMTDAQGIGPRR